MPVLSPRRSPAARYPRYRGYSFVRKMATKVTDFIPQSSWISKWFNPLQGNDDVLESRENIDETEDDTQQPPPNKRSRICMDTIHPPGTFSIQTRAKSALNTIESSKEQYLVHNEREDFSELATAGPSGVGRLISSTPAMQADIRTVTSHKSDLNLASSINNGIINGIDDNSESSESTSGCSSLIPQINRHEGPSNLYNSTFPSRKRHIDDKLTFTNHLQSPRSLFLDSNSRDTLSSRRPSFNASVMTNVLDRTSPLSSPFYSGNITFGGANAAGFYKQSRTLFNNSSELQLKVPRRTNVEVKPSNTVDDSSGMSQTAKKILEALEHFSSPISDAKKIPLKNTNNALFSGRKRSREEVASPSARIGLRHLTRELTVPTVPDILKLRRRQKLQDTTLAARKIVSSRSDPPPPAQEYRLRMDDADNEKYRGKLKGKSKINLEQEETVAPINLPNVPLPITTLPNFNFTLSFPALHSTGKTIANKENTFTFASPIKMPDVEKNLQSVNNYTFSNPINADDSASKTIDSSSCSITENIGSTAVFSTDGTTTSMPNFIWSGSSTAPRLKAKIKHSKDDFVEPVIVHEQKSESVMNVLSSKSKIESTLTEQSKSALVSEKTHTDKVISASIRSDLDIKNTFDDTLSWECNECLIKNSDTNKQCTACKVARPNPNDKTLSICSISTIDPVVKSKPVVDDCFGSQFKLSTNQWECTICCVRNKQNDVKCVACSAVKPGSNTDVMQQTTIKSQNYNLMERFKPAEGSWECPGCLLRNAANIITCPCCNASKPTSIKTNLKKTDTVTDSSLQKSSTADIDNMATQETTSSNYQIMNTSPKPTSIKTSPKKTDTVVATVASQKPNIVDTNSTAMQETSSNSEIMNKFKPSKDSWECPECLVRSNNSVTICPCCNTSKPNSFGQSSNAGQTSTKGFGDKFKKPEGSWSCESCFVQNDANQTQCVACQALKPGSVKSNKPALSTTSSTLQFKFGVPSDTSSLANSSGFNFGIDKADNYSNSDTVSPLNGFKFGNPQQVMRDTSTNATTTCLPTFAQPTFTFSDSKTQSATIPTFGQVPTTSAALSTNLSFGEKKPAETSTPSSDKSANDTPAATLFPIVSSSTSLFKNNESKTTIAFGTDKPSAFVTTDSSKPSGFIMPEKIPTFGSNTQDSKPSIFGTPETKLPTVFNSPSVNTLPTFGIPSSSSATPSLFGSSNNSAAFGNNTTPAFGNTATTPAATLFSSTKPSVETDSASNSSLFKFGSASSQQPASGTGSGFNFSANVNPATSSTKPLFTFGNNSTASPSSHNMFGSGTFGANTASTNTNANFTFNTPKQETPTAFGQGTATTPMFGAPQTNPQTQATSPSFSSTPLPSTGFNFASAAAPAAVSGGFNFGGMSSTPTGGFNYNPPTTTPTVVFDPNSRPSFNFTKGNAPTAFNAPSQSVGSQRKIKKAFRRCVR
ncbi:nuclear pore complex protein Nup153 isoform X2 [Anoplolepis gracilipes]|uniref:nuclear pore complex protein Nup153 isoform X2 n=1 Tax=Anoplolepis gracilipes TaxID=354296 RepID=UPI003BA15759